MGDNLRLRGFVVVDLCVMCRCCGETVDHLLLYCEKAHQLWYFAFRSFGVSWVLPITLPNFFFRLGKHLSNVWNLVPLCLMWCIWRECNRRTFEDVDSLEE